MPNLLNNMDHSTRILEILNSFTDESKELVFAKCEEYKLPPDRGDITLLEAFINLEQSRNILLDAIKKNQFSQVPLSIQKVILNAIERIKGFENSIIGGGDDIINLVNGIESLYSTIWTNGFHNMSSEFLGYTAKMNKLKEQEVRIENLMKEVEKGITYRDQIHQVYTIVQQSSEGIKNHENNAKASYEEIVKLSSDGLTALNQVNAHLATVAINDAAITQNAVTVKNSVPSYCS